MIRLEPLAIFTAQFHLARTPPCRLSLGMAASKTAEILVKRGVITADQLQRALELQRSAGGAIDSRLIELGLVDEQQLLTVLSHHYNIPVAELPELAIEETAVRLLPFSLAAKHAVMPVKQSNGVLTIVINDPSNISALNEIKFMTGLDLSVRLATSRAIHQLHEQFYEGAPAYDSLIGDVVQKSTNGQTGATPEIDISDISSATEDAPIVKLVNALLIDAAKKRASDIHVEPYEKGLRIRFRIDGVLCEIMNPPLRLKSAITARLKIMANLDIAEHRLPQDGRLKFRCGGTRDTDFRVNVLPTLFGEKVVLRLLDTSFNTRDISGLGFDADQRKLFEHAVSQPHGMILVTGPTGSGKTTTLYAALASLNKVSTNICTAEDPVEVHVPGINQTQINEGIHLSFAEALRAFLRQDPDVIMVGEIRDAETAEIAIKASMTGHLVLSTLHTNDAPSTISRLLNMGVAPYLVASSINLIVAQRLVRRICPDCSCETSIPTTSLIAAGVSDRESETFRAYQGKGCAKCSNTGYRGRIAIYEMMQVTDELRELILSGASALLIKQEALRLGMHTLRRSALRLLRDGTTSFEEVLRVTVQE